MDNTGEMAFVLSERTQEKLKTSKITTFIIWASRSQITSNYQKKHMSVDKDIYDLYTLMCLIMSTVT